MQRIVNAWSKAAHSGPASLEIFMAMYAIMWAILLQSPTMAGATVTKVLSGIQALSTWSLVLLTLGVVQIWATNGHYGRRRKMAFLGVMAWASLACLVFFYGRWDGGLSVLQAGTTTIQFAMMAIGYAIAILSLTLIWSGDRHD